MVAKIVAWFMFIVGCIMTITSYDYIKYSSFINHYSELEKLFLENYIEKGNMGIIGITLIAAAILIDIRETLKNKKTLHETLREYKEEPEETTDEEKTE